MSLGRLRERHPRKQPARPRRVRFSATAAHRACSREAFPRSWLAWPVNGRDRPLRTVYSLRLTDRVGRLTQLDASPRPSIYRSCEDWGRARVRSILCSLVRRHPGLFHLDLAVRIAGFGVLGAFTLVSPSGAPTVATAGFILVVLAWPVLSVSGTGLAASLTPIGEGAAMGLLAATSAMATLLGTVLAGPLVRAIGYRVASPIALAGLLGAAALTGTVRRDSGRCPADGGVRGI
jgi:MFS family permease